MPRLVRVLARMRAREVGDDYTYYGIASPWLQVRLCTRGQGLGLSIVLQATTAARRPGCRSASIAPPPAAGMTVPCGGSGSVPSTGVPAERRQWVCAVCSSQAGMHERVAMGIVTALQLRRPQA